MRSQPGTFLIGNITIICIEWFNLYLELPGSYRKAGEEREPTQSEAKDGYVFLAE